MIPDEAVEAALAVYDPSIISAPGDWDQYFKRRMRAALEASAPYIMAEALREAATELDRIDAIKQTPVRDIAPQDERDYSAFLRSGSHQAWLEARAVKMEATK